VNGFLQTQRQNQRNRLSRQSFRTAQQAAIAVLKLINKVSIIENAEYSGAICRDAQGRFRYVIPRRLYRDDPIGNPDNDDPRNTSPVPECPNGVMTGYYHTHAAWDESINNGPGADYNELFSAPDFDIAHGSNLVNQRISAWLATPTRRIYRYTPGQQWGVVDISRIYGRTPR
jgi:hypothetical protein